MQLVVFERLDASIAKGLDRGRERSLASAAATRETGSMGAAALGFETLEAVYHGHRRLGAILASGPSTGTVVDLNRALAVKLASSDAGAPEAEADSLLPADMAAFLRRLPDSDAAAREALQFVVDALERYDAPDLAAAGVALPRRNVRLAAPVPRPGKLIAVSHPQAEQAGAPALFLVAPTAVAGPEDEILLPAGARLRCWGQLAAVIGRRARGLDRDDALGCVAGYCAGIALRLEDPALPADGIRFSRDGFAPLGPALVTADEVRDPQDLRFELRISGRTVQAAHTKELPVPVADLVAKASQLMTLEPGDVVLTGAPQGGLREDPRLLSDGDVVEVEIERVGRLAVYVRAAGPGSAQATGV